MMTTYHKTLPIVVAVSAIAAVIVGRRFWPQEVGDAQFTHVSGQGVSAPESEEAKRVIAASNETSPFPIFTGYLTLGSDKWFALALPGAEDGIESASWYRIGQTIGQFEIAKFDPRIEALVLKDPNGHATEITLVEGALVSSNAQFRRILDQLIDTSPRRIRDIPSQIK
jgi:hypothetical protein